MLNSSRQIIIIVGHYLYFDFESLRDRKTENSALQQLLVDYKQPSVSTVGVCQDIWKFPTKQVHKVGN